MATKKITERWMPMNEVTRNGEQYVYVGDTQNTTSMKNHNKNFNVDQGRKTTFVNDKDDKDAVCMYVSKQFYPKMCKTVYPAYGKGTLVRGPTW